MVLEHSLSDHAHPFILTAGIYFSQGHWSAWWRADLADTSAPGHIYLGGGLVCDTNSCHGVAKGATLKTPAACSGQWGGFPAPNSLGLCHSGDKREVPVMGKDGEKSFTHMAAPREPSEKGIMSELPIPLLKSKGWGRRHSSATQFADLSGKGISLSGEWRSRFSRQHRTLTVFIKQRE